MAIGEVYRVNGRVLRRGRVARVDVPTDGAALVGVGSGCHFPARILDGHVQRVPRNPRGHLYPSVGARTYPGVAEQSLRSRQVRWGCCPRREAVIPVVHPRLTYENRFVEEFSRLRID